jgi:predicted PurR-regulated permease PerM
MKAEWRGGETVAGGLAAAETPPVEPRATSAQRARLLLGLLGAAFVALQLFSSILLPFAMAIVLAYILHPGANRLERLGVPRGAASILLVLAVIGGVLLFILLLYPPIVTQVSLLIGRVPHYAAQIQDWAQQFIAWLQARLGDDFPGGDKLRDLVSGQASAMLSLLGRTLSQVIGGGFALFNVLSLLVVTPIVAFYVLRDWNIVVALIDRWLPLRYAPVIRAQALEVDRILSAWVRGQALCCFLLAAYYMVALSFVGLDLGLIVGLATGVLSFIPYVGSVTGGVLSVGLALSQFSDWRGVIEVALVLGVGQILEGYVIYPRFLGDRVELPAVWVIFALFAGGAGFGFLGVMLAVPVAATIGVLSRFWLRRYLRSPLYLDPPR